MAKKFLGIRLKEEDYAFLQSFKPNGTITEAVEAAIQQLRNFQTTTQKLPNSDTRSIPSSDIPTTTPSLEERAETNPALKEVLTNIQHKTAPPCPFCAKINENEVECGKTIKEGKKPIRMTIESCQQCYARREYVQKKMQRDKEDKEAEDGFPKTPNCPNLYRKTTQLKNQEGKPFIYCSHYGDWKTPEFCWDCFTGHRASVYVSDAVPDEEEGEA